MNTLRRSASIRTIAEAYKDRRSTYLRAGDSDKANADFAAARRLKSGQKKAGDVALYLNRRQRPFTAIKSWICLGNVSTI